MDNKTDLRIRAKSIRKNLDINSISLFFVEKIRQLDYYQKAKNILLFYPMKYEINLLPLLDDEKNFYFPKVYEEQLLICPYKKGDIVINSELNIKEPCSNPVNPQILDLVIVPALMADSQGFRLGYGGGFYDRFLAENPHVKTVLPIPEELYVEKLPRDEFDIPVDYVIVKKRLKN